LRAIAALDPNTEQSRRAIYGRARQALTRELRASDPPVPEPEISAQLLALELAIERVEAQSALAELARTEASSDRVHASYRSDAPDDDWEAEDLPPAYSRSRRNLALMAVGIAALAVLGGFALWSLLGGNTTERGQRGPRSVGAQPEAGTLNSAEAKKLDSQLPYFFRRQPVYFRTNYPVGSVVIQKSQRFLYLVRPNVVAWRYGIAISDKCVDVNGVLRVAAKEDTTGNAGNALKVASGQRILLLDKDAQRIAGTDAPKTIGQLVPRGCVYLVDGDFVDLYDRVPVGTSVVFGN
jgi:lipoprotein-anchoring transpeptidase ErfK/SrfK